MSGVKPDPQKVAASSSWVGLYARHVSPYLPPITADPKSRVDLHEVFFDAEVFE